MSSQAELPTAPRLYACFACRESKRKCDRTAPSCDQCRLKNEQCIYPWKRKRRVVQNLILTPAESSVSPSDVGILDTTAELMAEYFLDPDLFQFAGLEIPAVEVSFLITEQISAAVGDTAAIHFNTKLFFKTVHRWIPIIHKDLFYSLLMSRLVDRRAETYLLILSMTLLSSTPTEALSPLYRLTKQFHAQFGAYGILSLLVSQASVLITMYELGHGIYPAAFISVSQCARYATAQRIHESLLTHSCPPGTDLEECRRLWWSILILDRFMNLCDPTRHLVTPDPNTESYLPLDDQDWDTGKSNPQSAYTLANANSYLLGRFARFAQAAHLLSLLLAQVGQGSQDTTQLRKTIFSLVNVSRIESHMRRLELCTQMAACYAGILLLDFPGSINSGIGSPATTDESTLSEESTAILLLALDMAQLFTREFVAETSEFISPFLVHLVYKVASVCMTLSSDTSMPGFVKDGHHTLKESLVWLGQRWLVSRTYGILLERRETLLKQG